MNFNQINLGVQTVSAMPYVQAPLRPTSESGPRPGATNNDDLSKLLSELGKVLDQATEAQDPEQVKALLSVLEANPAARTTGAGVLPPALVELLTGVTESAEGTGQAEAFRDLLREYVAVRWALSELDALGRINADNAAKAEYHLRQLEQARAFLEQLEVAISRRLDKMVSQTIYMNWRMLYRNEFETKPDPKDEAVYTTRSLPEGVDAVGIVALLLEDAPRPDLDHVSQLLQALSNQAQAQEIPDAEPYDPYH